MGTSCQKTDCIAGRVQGVQLLVLPFITFPGCLLLTTVIRSAHQRFFKLMLMAAKVPACAQIALDAVRDGMCVVIGLQSTGEANTNAVGGQGGQVIGASPPAIQRAHLLMVCEYDLTLLLAGCGETPQ